jgi:ABC-2 type transport system permease protein
VNPRRIYADLTVFARGYLRNQVALFFSLAFPVILVLLFGLIFNQPTATVTLYAVNFDHGGNASTQFLSALNETGAVNVVVLGPAQLPNNESLATYLSDNSDPVGIVIPAGFTSDYVTHQPTIVTLYSNPEDQVSGGIAEAAVEGVSNQFNLQLSNGSPVIGVDVEPLASTIYKEIDYLVPGLIGFSILTSPMFAMVDISSTYKKDHLFRQLSLTPLQKDEWLTAKIIWYVILSMVSAVLMVGIGLVAFHAHVSLSLGMLPFLVLGPFFFVSLGMLAGSLAKTPESAAVIGNVITFPMMFLSGTFFPVTSFPPYLQSFAHILPLYYVIDGLNKVMLFNNFSGAVTDIGVLAVSSVVVFVMAILTFKWRDE